jgi:hypothetical protein
MPTLISFFRLLNMVVLTFGIGTGLAFVPGLSHTLAGSSAAFAREDEEDEDEDEDEEEDEKDEHEDEGEEDEHRPRSTPSATIEESVVETVKVEKVPKTKTVIREIIEETPVVETYIVIDPGYDTDGDSDSLVDALDPDPTLHQSAYFTDDDGDSVPNALDQEPGADDILSLDELDDADGDGILDRYESL